MDQQLHFEELPNNNFKEKVEAVLFLSDTPLFAKDIAFKLGVDSNLVRKALTQLIQEYETRETALEIATDNGYMMRIKEKFSDLGEKVLPFEIKTGCLRTLSAIALHEPIMQNKLIEMRGGGAYDHMKELLDMGLISKIKDDKTYTIRTTKLFAEYFKLSNNGLELQDMLQKEVGDVQFKRV